MGEVRAYDSDYIDKLEQRIAELEKQIQLEQQYSEDLVQTGADLEVDNERLRAAINDYIDSRTTKTNIDAAQAYVRLVAALKGDKS